MCQRKSKADKVDKTHAIRENGDSKSQIGLSRDDRLKKEEERKIVKKSNQNDRNCIM